MKSPLERLTCEQIVIFPSNESNLATRLFNANVKQVINVTQLVVGKMVAEKQPGAVVNVSSQASQAALGDHTVYCATKGALDMVTKWVEKNWEVQLSKSSGWPPSSLAPTKFESTQSTLP